MEHIEVAGQDGLLPQRMASVRIAVALCGAGAGVVYGVDIAAEEWVDVMKKPETYQKGVNDTP